MRTIDDGGCVLKIMKLIKIVCSLILSFAILNIVCFFYYNVPVHSESKTHSTDYVWETDKFYSTGIEGYAWGKTDENGFNNLNAEYGVNPEILVMGSSHTEGMNVSQKENYVYLLNAFFEQNADEFKAYNIGISGHTLTTCLNNLKNAIEEFKPTKYVVIEVANAELSLDDINKISEGTVKKIHSTANPVLVFLQKIPFVRCVYHQIDKLGFLEKKPNKTVTDTIVKTTIQDESNTSESNDEYDVALNSMLNDLSVFAEKNGVRLIIFLNPNLDIDKNGNVVPRQPSSEEKSFVNSCKSNNIEYIDMYDAYTEAYNKTDRLMHGFSNTTLGKGHLNKYGHQIVANILYEHIIGMENHNSIE